MMLNVNQCRIELDHLFVCAAPSAPEAEQFIRYGFREAPSNRHLGQGTANRRFSFANAMIELLWVSDPEEAQSQIAKPTLLWERWSGRHGGTSPFGICVRPADPKITPAFPAWEYRPPYLPDPLVIHIAEAGVEEPMWVYMGFMRQGDRERRFVAHPNGVRKITGLSLTSPTPPRSAAAQILIENRIVRNRLGAQWFLEVDFDSRRQKQVVDFRPQLPLKFQL
jgi:hypothetical protein